MEKRKYSHADNGLRLGHFNLT